MSNKLACYIAISIFLSIILSWLNFFLAPTNYNVEKAAIYECGFDPISDSRDRFDLRFYLFAILFIVFDIEILFIWPWIISLFFSGAISLIFIYFFFAVLTLGFFFEWVRGALEWA